MAEEVTPQAPETGSKKSGSGLEPNVAAMLAYLFGWVSGLVFFLIEKDNKFVRFAAAQSIVLSVAMTLLWFVYGWISSALLLTSIMSGGLAIAGILTLVSWVIGVGFLVVWIMLMVRAYQNQEWELPVVGKIARNFVK